MVKLIVVAGSTSQKLAEFFANRGTFEIVAVYDNLANNVNQIQNKVIVSDKLLYLYNDSEETNMNIKSDMQILGNLLSNDSFFKPGEIVFMTTASAQAKLAIKFFSTIMEDCKKSDYSIKTVEDKMSFIAIYNLLMGTTNSSDFKNSYTTLYKVERNTVAEEEYSPQDDRDLLIEPFGMDSVNTYIGKQKAAKKADVGTIYTDDPDTDLAQESTVQFDPLKLHSILDKTKYIFVSGMKKSGKSVWGSQLAVSASKCDLATGVFDFTDNQDVLPLLQESSVQVSDVSLLQILRQQEKEYGITYASTSNDDEIKVLPEFLQLFFDRKVELFDVVFVICEFEQLLNLRNLFIGDVSIVVTTNAVLNDVSATCDKLPIFDEHSKCTLILNNVASLNNEYMDAIDVRAMLPNELRLVKAKTFTKFDAKGQLFSALFGGKK